MSLAKSSKPLVANQPAKKTGCSEAVMQVFQVAEAEPFTGFVVIGEDKFGKPSMAFCGFSKEQFLWNMMVAMTNLHNDRQCELGSSQPSGEGDHIRAKVVKKILKQVQTKQLNKVVVVGEVGGKTVMSFTGFTKKSLLPHLTAAAEFSINYGDLIPACTE